MSRLSRLSCRVRKVREEKKGSGCEQSLYQQLYPWRPPAFMTAELLKSQAKSSGSALILTSDRLSQIGGTEESGVVPHIGKERDAVTESASDVKTGRRQTLSSRSPMKGDSCHTGDYRDEGILNTATDWR